MKKLLYTSALVMVFLQPHNALAETMNKQMAFQKALQNNPSYIAALADIDMADGERLQASLLPNPNAILEVENFAGDDEQEGFDGAEITLGIEQTIEIGGKRQNRNDISNFSYRIAQEQAKSSALSVLAETEYAFVRAGIAQDRISLANKRLALADKTHTIVKKRVGAAKAADIQHTKADIEKSASQHNKSSAACIR
jgi:cobalt-zinc-cadmium efflux system outer membrane protein